MTGTGSNRGIIYVATGKKYVEEAIASALSCREYMPQLPIHLFTDLRTEHKVFSSVGLLTDPMHNAADKILPLIDSPFEQAVFLDTDTQVCSEFPELFELIDRFDLAVTHAPWRTAYPASRLLLPPIDQSRIPAAFPEFNTGLIAFRKNPVTDELFRQWHARHTSAVKRGDKPPHDQPAFRAAMYQSQCRFFVLTPEYNCRFNVPSSVCGRVKVLHGRRGQLTQVAQIINADSSPRVYVEGELYRREGRKTLKLDDAHHRPFLGRADWSRPLLTLAAWRLRKRTNFRVIAGPFAGMEFHHAATGMTYYPKILGTYELELQPVIEEIARTPFTRVINAGAGDGYFAVGFARLFPNASVVAFELGAARQAHAKSLAHRNGVLDRVRIEGSCDVAALRANIETNSLVFMDVEGAEDELLDPKAISQLRSATIVVEIHDTARPGIGSRLRARFAETHTVTEIWADPRRVSDFPWKNAAGRPLFSRDICLALMNENRPAGMRWFYLRPNTVTTPASESNV